MQRGEPLNLVLSIFKSCLYGLMNNLVFIAPCLSEVYSFWLYLPLKLAFPGRRIRNLFICLQIERPPVFPVILAALFWVLSSSNMNFWEVSESELQTVSSAWLCRDSIHCSLYCSHCLASLLEQAIQLPLAILLPLQDTRPLRWKWKTFRCF